MTIRTDGGDTVLQRISAEDMECVIESSRAGEYFARYGVNDFMGYANLDGEPILYRGKLPDVLEMFLPYKGTNRVAHDPMWGISVTQDGVRWLSEDEMGKVKPYKRKRKKGA